MIRIHIVGFHDKILLEVHLNIFFICKTQTTFAGQNFFNGTRFKQNCQIGYRYVQNYIWLERQTDQSKISIDQSTLDLQAPR